MNASIVCLVELLILRNSKGNFQFQRLVCIIADLNLAIAWPHQMIIKIYFINDAQIVHQQRAVWLLSMNKK